MSDQVGNPEDRFSQNEAHRSPGDGTLMIERILFDLASLREGLKHIEVKNQTSVRKLDVNWLQLATKIWSIGMATSC